MKVFGFAGRSGSGKTTLMERVIPLLAAGGLRVSVIKHTHHAFDVDRPGKDSYRHREAGAVDVLLTSDTRWVLMHELRDAPEPELCDQLARLSPCDLVLVEGFKRQPIPKLEVYRSAAGTAPLFPGDPHIVALAADVAVHGELPIFGLTDYAAIAAFIRAHVGLDLPATAVHENSAALRTTRRAPRESRRVFVFFRDGNRRMARAYTDVTFHQLVTIPPRIRSRCCAGALAVFSFLRNFRHSLPFSGFPERAGAQAFNTN